ncbi:MAG: LLM class flavin-dependent oxidoreductase [Deltaproteobacteria bacterium]|nr:LLM class flavin-dependent oxidoreductase [Deltaproteobacteria bacterium]
MRFNLHGSARTVADVLRRARAAERAGFEGIFLADSQMNSLDPFQLLALAAAQTNRLRLGTAVTNIVYRDPTILANSAATLNETSDGRAVLGIGTGDGPVYSLGRSATRLSEFAEGLRLIRDLLHAEGITVAKSKERRAEGRVRLRVGKLPVPLYVSAEGPRILRLAGRFADGVILGTGFDLEVLKWARERIAEGADEAGRRVSEIDIMPAGMICADEDGSTARKRVRSRLANRAHHNFRFTLETVPPAELEGVKRFMAAFDMEQPIEQRVGPDLVTDYLVERFAIAGTAAECVARLKALEEFGVRRIMVTPPEAIYDAVIEAWASKVIPSFLA